MQITMRSLAINLFLLLCAPVFVMAAQQQPPPNPAPQIYQGRLEITVTGLERVHRWEVLANSGYYLTPKNGADLIVVKFKIKNVQTGEEDTGEKRVQLHLEELKDFEFEDTQGKKYPSAMKHTNLREVPLEIPKGTELKLFRMVGLTFDIHSLATRLDKK